MLNKIGDEIIVVNDLLNKLELEIQYQEQTNSSLKVMLFYNEENNKKALNTNSMIPREFLRIL